MSLNEFIGGIKDDLRVVDDYGNNVIHQRLNPPYRYFDEAKDHGFQTDPDGMAHGSIIYLTNTEEFKKKEEAHIQKEVDIITEFRRAIEGFEDAEDLYRDVTSSYYSPDNSWEEELEGVQEFIGYLQQDFPNVSSKIKNAVLKYAKSMHDLEIEGDKIQDLRRTHRSYGGDYHLEGEKAPSFVTFRIYKEKGGRVVAQSANIQSNLLQSMERSTTGDMANYSRQAEGRGYH